MSRGILGIIIREVGSKSPVPLNLGRRILNDLVLDEVIALPVDKVAHNG